MPKCTECSAKVWIPGTICSDCLVEDANKSMSTHDADGNSIPAMESTRGSGEAENVKADKARDAVTGSAVLSGIGHTTSLLLLAAGISMMFLGFFIKEEYSVGWSNPFESLLVIIIGGGSVVVGALMTAVTIGTWVFASAMQYFGRGKVGWTIAILVLALFIFSLWLL